MNPDDCILRTRPMLSRARRTFLGEWWWTVDRLQFSALIVLMVTGLVLMLAASPPVAIRLGADPFHFVNRHALYLAPTLLVLLASSMLSPRQVRRVALIVFAVALLLTVATLYVGPEIKGARRWLPLFGAGIQPSEFMKPAFVLLAAWAFSESARRPEMPATLLAFALLAAATVPLVFQPDIGQTALLVLVWSALFFLAGMRVLWLLSLAGAAAAGLVAAYYLVPHVTARINRFLDPGSGSTFQIDTALESFVRGGWFGRGPGEGTVKRILPDGHADFVFAVAAEEFGIVLCLILVSLFAFIVLRALAHAMRDEDPFGRFAVAGLALMFGIQAAIAMAVNLSLMPAKGMTLPFVSYGGSSMISLAYAMGTLIALSRRRPQAEAVAEFELEAARGSARA
jgi:cell division protein FtsW